MARETIAISHRQAVRAGASATPAVEASTPSAHSVATMPAAKTAL